MRRIRYNQLPNDWVPPAHLSRCEIFVFESTLEGEHTEGNAKIAYERFGAEWGVGDGRRGQTYAIPTNFMSVEEDFEPFVQDFIEYVKNQRIHIHKVFRDIAQRGKCSMGWFFGFKLHLIYNEKGELLNFMITLGDVDDRKPLEYKAFVEFIYGKLVADKGYISKNHFVKTNEQSQACLSYAMARNGRIYTNLFQRLFVDGIQLITKLKNNMKGALISVSDKLLLRKRAIIETVNVSQKAVYQCKTYIRHTAESILNSSNSRYLGLNTTVLLQDYWCNTRRSTGVIIVKVLVYAKYAY